MGKIALQHEPTDEEMKAHHLGLTVEEYTERVDKLMRQVQEVKEQE